MKKIISSRLVRATAAATVALIPMSVFAQISSGSGPTLCTVAQKALGYFNLAIELIIGLAIVVFVASVFHYFFTTQENSKRGSYVLWSIIGFAVMACFWGLVNLVGNSFGLNNSSAPSFFGNIIGSNNVASPCSSSNSNTSNSTPTLNSQGNEFTN